MYNLVVFFAVVAVSAAKPNCRDPLPHYRPIEPLAPCHTTISPHCHHEIPPPCQPEVIRAPPCEETSVEKFSSPCVDKEVTTFEGPIVEKIITPAPIVEKFITSPPVVENVYTPCSGSLFNRVITPITVPTTVSHTYRKEIINEPVLASYPATVPVASKTVYTTPYYPIAPYYGGFPAPCSSPFAAAQCAAPCGSPYPAPYPASYPAPYPVSPCAAPFPAAPCAAPFPAPPCAAPFSVTYPAFSTLPLPQIIPQYVEHKHHEPRPQS